jgi:hypothetical protein
MAATVELTKIYITGESERQEWNDRKEGVEDLWQERTLQR